MISAHDFGEYKSYKDEYSQDSEQKRPFREGAHVLTVVARVEILNKNMHAKSKIIVLEGLI